MQETEINLSNGKTAKGYVIALGPVNLVLANTEKAMVACGAFDVDVLDKYNYPAAKVRGLSGRIGGVDDLLEGKVIYANKKAAESGVKVDMSGREALEAV